MEEKYLTPRQRKWLDESRRIGSGPFTPSDRKVLESLYADMSPEEQEELADYIQDTFMKPDPITLREKMTQKEPSARLKELLTKGLGTSRPPVS